MTGVDERWRPGAPPRRGRTGSGAAAQLVAAAHQHAYRAGAAVPARRRRDPGLGAAAAQRQHRERQRLLRRRTPTLAPVLDRLWRVRRLRLALVLRRSTCCCSPRSSAASCPGCATTSARCAPVPPDAPRRLDRLPQHAVACAARPAGRGGDRGGCCAGGAGGSRCGGDGTVSAEKGYLKETGNLLFHFSLVARAGRGGARLVVRLARQPAAGGRPGHGVLQHPPAVRRVRARAAGATPPTCPGSAWSWTDFEARSSTSASRSRSRATVAGRRGRRADRGSVDFSVNARCAWTARTSTCSATGTRRCCATPTGTARRRPAVAAVPATDDMLTSEGVAAFPDANIDPATGERDPNAQVGVRKGSTCRRRRTIRPVVPLGAPGRAQPGADAAWPTGATSAWTPASPVGLRARPAADRSGQAEQVGHCKLLRKGETWTLGRRHDSRVPRHPAVRGPSPSGTTRVRRSCWSARAFCWSG